MFKYIFIVLLIVTVAVVAYDIGATRPPLGMHEVKCDDINGMYNVYTKKMDTVCEVNLKAEDDNIIIYKGD